MKAPHQSGLDSSLMDPGHAERTQPSGGSIGTTVIPSSRRYRDPDSTHRTALKSTSHRSDAGVKPSNPIGSTSHQPGSEQRSCVIRGASTYPHRPRSRSGRVADRSSGAMSKHHTVAPLAPDYVSRSKVPDSAHKSAFHTTTQQTSSQQQQHPPPSGPVVQPYGPSPSESVSTTTDSRDQDRRQFTTEEYISQPLFGRLVVDIVKGEESSLGLTVSSGNTEGEPPIIANIRPGSIADRSDCLLVDDRIISINNNYTSKLRYEDNVRLAKSTGPWIRMELEYELPELPPAGCTVKHMLVELETRADGTGLVLRGGWNRLPSHIRPLTVMHIRENSIAACDGRIKPGDRILAINNVQTGQLTCEEAIKLIGASRHRLTLVVEYNVANFETDRSISGAVMVEIEKPGNEDLGISLAPCHEVKTGQNAFFINHIRQGSIGDRCGALFVGDRLEAIDDIHVEDLTLQEAMHRLKHNGLDSVRLQIVPNAITDVEKQSRIGAGRLREPTRMQPVPQLQQQQHIQPHLSQWPSSPPTLSRTRSRSKGQSRATEPLTDVTPYGFEQEPRYAGEEDEISTRQDGHVSGTRTSEWNAELKQYRNIAKSLTSLHSLAAARAEICRCEEVEVRLEMDDTYNYGLSLCAPGHGTTAHTQLVNFPLVEHVEPGSVAYKSGVIQEGDRVITMNGQSTLNHTVEELTAEFLRPDTHRHRGPVSLTLVTQYSVADTVVPSSGVFDVKLVRRAANLGINLQASITKQDGQPLLISKVIPGSVASRSGSINPGDILLAVNGVYLSSCSLAEAIRLLQSPSEEIVTLRIQKIADASMISTDPDSGIARFTGSRRSQYARSDSVPESEFGRGVPVPSWGSATMRHKSEPEVDISDLRTTYDRSRLVPEATEMARSMAGSAYESKSGDSIGRKLPKTQLVAGNLENHIQTDRSTSSGQDELRPSGMGSSGLGGKSCATPIGGSVTGGGAGSTGIRSTCAMSLQESLSIQGDIQSIVGTHDSSDNRSRLISSPEDMSQDDGVSVVRVTLRRKSAECPWGIIICGTDDASNAPVFIDSLNPGDPGAASGLLFPGDRILAINGNALHAGHTLTQAMRMLQRYPDRVVLHVARQHRISEPELGRSPQSIPENRKRLEPEIDSRIVMDEPTTSRIDQKTSLLRKPSLKKAVATSNFSRSFDSITNSVGSGGNVTELAPSISTQDALSAVSAPAGTVTARPKSTPAVCYPIQDVPGGTASRTRSFGTTDRELIESKVSDDIHDPNWSQVTRTIGKVRTPSDRPKRSLTRPSAGPIRPRDQLTATDSLFQDWTGAEPTQYSGTSEGGNEELAGEIQDHPEFYPTITDYNDLDLDSIQCPGCREAILNEIRQQKEMTRQLARQHQMKKFQSSKSSPQQHPSMAHQRHQAQPYRQRPVHRRTRSHQRSAGSSSFEALLESSCDRPQPSDNRTTEMVTSSKPGSSLIRESSAPKAVFYCPELETPTPPRNLTSQHPIEQSTIPNSTMFTRHSKSDSRLNLACRPIETDRSHETVLSGPCTSGIAPGSAAQTTLPVHNLTTPSRRLEQMEEKNYPRGAVSRPAPPVQHQHLFPHPHQHQSLLMSESRSDTQSVAKRQSGPITVESTGIRDQIGSRGGHPILDRFSVVSGRSQTEGREFVYPDSASVTREKLIRSSERGVWCTWIRLTKASVADSYGIGVSEGISTRGIFVSAIRPNSSADRSSQLHLYDRILMVNDVPVDDLSCSEVVGLISQSEKYLDLLIQRRIARPRTQQSRDPSGPVGRAGIPSVGATSISAGISKSPASRQTATRRKSSTKRSQHTNLTVL